MEQFLKAGLTEIMARRIVEWRRHFDVMKEFDWLKKRGIIFLERADLEFPKSLLQIPDPPFGLYRKGAPLVASTVGQTSAIPKSPDGQISAALALPIKRLPAKHIAIVGTRQSTLYGERIATQIAQKIAAQDGIVVSGLALGIDGCAHRGCINEKKPTIAVLASPVDAVTPSSHANLAERILQHGGTLISEYYDREFFSKYRFHERNRIISGLCEATIVIEAPIKSGALITAQKALDQNRDVYVLPGDITKPQAQGCLKLIYDGAIPILSIDNLLIELGFKSTLKVVQQTLTLEELEIAQTLQKRPSTAEDLLRNTMLPINKIQALLSTLELKGIIQRNRAFLWEVTPEV